MGACVSALGVRVECAHCQTTLSCAKCERPPQVALVDVKPTMSPADVVIDANSDVKHIGEQAEGQSSGAPGGSWATMAGKKLGGGGSTTKPAVAVAASSSTPAAKPAALAVASPATGIATATAKKSDKHLPFVVPAHEFHECIFFPDAALPCFAFLEGRACRKANCAFAHEQTNFSRFLSVLDSAQRTLDVCVFTVTNDSIAQALSNAHRRGVVVRIITDDDCMVRGLRFIM